MDLVVGIQAEDLGLQSSLRATADREEKDSQRQSELRRHHAHDGELPDAVQHAQPCRAEVYQRILDDIARDLLVDANADVGTPR